MFKKKDPISKLWLKLTDKAAYKTYKWDLVNYRQTQFTDNLIGEGKLNNAYKIIDAAKANGKINLLHSGNAGDIIYALATIKAIQHITEVPINLYLKLGRAVNLPNYNSHPIGGVMLNQKMADMLIPLLKQQPYLNECDIYNNQPIDIDLDFFRAGVTPQNGNIARWCSYITGVSPALWQPWLTVAPDDHNNNIIIARSGRYQNQAIDYSFLQRYGSISFLGIESEYEDMLRFLPNLKWLQVDNFLHMARIIAGCKLFIGNQSFPYAVAEALKVPRILEVSFEIINVVPEGPNGYDFFYQGHVEYLVDKLLTNDEAK